MFSTFALLSKLLTTEAAGRSQVSWLSAGHRVHDVSKSAQRVPDGTSTAYLQLASSLNCVQDLQGPDINVEGAFLAAALSRLMRRELARAMIVESQLVDGLGMTS